MLIWNKAVFKKWYESIAQKNIILAKQCRGEKAECDSAGQHLNLLTTVKSFGICAVLCRLTRHSVLSHPFRSFIVEKKDKGRSLVLPQLDMPCSVVTYWRPAPSGTETEDDRRGRWGKLGEGMGREEWEEMLVGM